jgi:hypothetical protein
MSKKFELSEKRFVVIKKDEVRLFEDGTSKWATFTYPRWAHFVEQFVEIDESVTKLTAGQQDIKVQLHVGGGWYVSVTSGFYCVDEKVLLPARRRRAANENRHCSASIRMGTPESSCRGNPPAPSEVGSGSAVLDPSDSFRRRGRNELHRM